MPSPTRTGWAHERGYHPRGRHRTLHGNLVAGLSLEAGDLARAAEVIADLRALPRIAKRVLPRPGVPCRLPPRVARGGGAALAEFVEFLARRPWRSGEEAHDLVSAALHAGLSLPRVRELATATLPPDPGTAWRAPEWKAPQWRWLVEAQLAEAEGATEAALLIRSLRTHVTVAVDGARSWEAGHPQLRDRCRAAS